MFEGEFLFCKKWTGIGYDKYGKKLYEIKNGTGKIKEYHDNGNIYFEGEYLNGEKIGKVKEYNTYGRLVFEGEYINGKRNGIVKEYNFDHTLIFEGNYKNGERNGKEREYYFGSEFIGEYLNGKRFNGKGIEKEYSNQFGEIEYEKKYINGESHILTVRRNGKIIN